MSKYYVNDPGSGNGPYEHSGVSGWKVYQPNSDPFAGQSSSSPAAQSSNPVQSSSNPVQSSSNPTQSSSNPTQILSSSSVWSSNQETSLSDSSGNTFLVSYYWTNTGTRLFFFSITNNSQRLHRRYLRSLW